MWILIELLACYADSSLPCRETIRDPITCKMILLIADNHASGVHMHISSAIILCHFGFLYPSPITLWRKCRVCQSSQLQQTEYEMSEKCERDCRVHVSRNYCFDFLTI